MRGIVEPVLRWPTAVTLEIDAGRFVDHGGLGRGILDGIRVGIAHHLGWAVAVTASTDYKVVDRRRIELIEPGVATAPIHHEGKPLGDAATAARVVKVRASAVRSTSASLDELATAVPEPIVSMSLRAWPLDFPDDIAVQRRAPYEAHADSIMYRQVLAEQARARGWDVHLYSAKDIESQAVSILGDRADEVLHGPRATLGPPWGKGPSGGTRRDDRGRLNVEPLRERLSMPTGGPSMRPRSAFPEPIADTTADQRRY